MVNAVAIPALGLLGLSPSYKMMTEATQGTRATRAEPKLRNDGRLVII